MRTKARTFLLPALLLLVCLSFPRTFTEGMRGTLVASFTPIWRYFVDFKLLAQAPFERISRDDRSDLVRTKDQEIRRLLLENQMLGNEVHRLQEIVEQEYKIFHEMLDAHSLQQVPHSSAARHEKEILRLFNLELMHMPARVIFRPVNAWNSSLWIDKGEADNVTRKVIAKNSPVVIGTCVVGVVDEVGTHQSRVRLITDSGLNPSVRIKRGEHLLAKGELQGQSLPLWRSHQSFLKGVGFNYDFGDDEGPARDLRSGDSLDPEISLSTMPLVKLNDLLVTTGMDGVFPPGLEVGVVKRIYPLKEGDYTYSLEAQSSAGDLNALTIVFVLPPLSPDCHP
jgi:rod shape-determining protein MreC